MKTTSEASKHTFTLCILNFEQLKVSAEASGSSIRLLTREFPFTRQRELRAQLYYAAVEFHSYLSPFPLMIPHRHELRS